MPSILLIESDTVFARSLAATFEPAGYAVTTVSDGQAGLDRARTARPDAIVLCAELPEGSGFAVCSRLRRAQELSSIPLILISSEATPEAIEAHKQNRARADAYLLKPFAPEALLDQVMALTRGTAPTPAVATPGAALPPDLPPPMPGQGATAPAAGAEVLSLTDLAEDLDLDFEPAAEPLTSPAPPPLPKGNAAPRRRKASPTVDDLSDPFAALVSDARMPRGASPDEKLTFFRDRINLLEAVIQKGRDGWTELTSRFAELRGDAEAYQDHLAILEQDISDRDEAIAAREVELVEAEDAHESLEERYMEARGEASLLQDETNQHLATIAELEEEVVQKGRAHADAMEAAEQAKKDLSEVLNETLREREEDHKSAAARIAEAEARVAHLEDAHKDAIEQLRVEGALALEEAENRHTSTLDDLQREADERESQTQAEQATEIAALREAHEEAIEETRRSAEERVGSIQADLEGEKAALEAALQAREQEIGGKLAELEELEERLGESLKAGGRLTQEKKDLETKLQAMIASEKEQQETVEEIESQLGAIQEALQSTQGEAEALRTELEKARNEAQASTARASEQLAAAEGRVAELEQSIATLKLDLDERERSLLEERESTLVVKSQLTSLESKSVDLENAVASKDTDLAEIRGESDAREMELESLRTQVEDLQKTVEAETFKGNAARAELDEIRASTGSLQDDVGDAQDQAKRFAADLEEERKLRRDALDKLQVYREELKALKKAARGTDAGEMARLKKAVLEREQRLDRVAKELEKLQAAHKNELAEVERTVRRKAGTGKGSASLEARVKELEEEVEDLQAQNEFMEEQLSNMD